MSARSRRRKLRLFVEHVHPGPETTVLDVGVDDLGYGEAGEWATANFLEEHYPWRERITAVADHEGLRFRERYPEVAYVRGDGCALPFPDGAFDVCFSNAVLEHVGARDRQQLFVAEAVRVARRVFLTTPNRLFPLEVHTRLPFVHWLPEGVAARVYELAGKPLARELELLTPRALRELFPDPRRVRILVSPLQLVAVAEGETTR